MGEVMADSRDKSFLRELIPGVWRLTGEISSNVIGRANFTAQVIFQAGIARLEDLNGALNPMSAREILDCDARKHIGAMAVEKGLSVPESFVPQD